MRVKVAGVGLDYDAGGAGRPLLALHGWSSDRHTFLALRPRLEDRFRILAPDLPGFGASERPDRAMTIAYYAEVAQGFLRALGVAGEPAPLLMGHSMGAMIALEMMAVAPDDFAGAVLLDPAPIVWTDRLRSGMEATLAGLRRDTRATQAMLRDKAFFRGHEPEWLHKELAATAEMADPGATVAAFEDMLAWNGPDALARAAARPLLYVGADKPQNREGDLRALDPDIYWGRTIGQGHFNHILAPAQVGAMIDDFVALAIDG